MEYTLRISDKSPQAKSIIKMLESLEKEYDFLQISENACSLTEEQERELNRRHRHVKKNPDIGKTWEEFEKNL